MAVKKGIGTTGIVIISSVVLVGLGVGLYFILRKKEGKENAEDDSDVEDESTTEGNEGGKEVSTKSAKCPPPTGLKITKPKDVSTKEFQKWVDKKGKAYVDSDCTYYNFCTGSRVKKGVCGSWGQQTQKAWNKYSKEYLKKKGGAGAECKTWKEWFYGVNLPYMQSKPKEYEAVLEGIYERSKNEPKLKEYTQYEYNKYVKESKCKNPEKIGFDGTRSYYDIQSNMTGEIDELRGTEIF